MSNGNEIAGMERNPGNFYGAGLAILALTALLTVVVAGSTLAAGSGGISDEGKLADDAELGELLQMARTHSRR